MNRAVTLLMFAALATSCGTEDAEIEIGTPAVAKRVTLDPQYIASMFLPTELDYEERWRAVASIPGFRNLSAPSLDVLTEAWKCTESYCGAGWDQAFVTHPVTRLMVGEALFLNGRDPGGFLAEVGRQRNNVDMRIRAPAVLILAKVGGEAEIPVMLEVLRTDPSFTVAIQAAYGLLSMNSKEARLTLRNALSDLHRYRDDARGIEERISRFLDAHFIVEGNCLKPVGFDDAIQPICDIEKP